MLLRSLRASINPKKRGGGEGGGGWKRDGREFVQAHDAEILIVHTHL